MRAPIYLLLLLLLLINLTFTFTSTLNQQQQQQPCPKAIRINTNHLFRNALHFICLQPPTQQSIYPTLEVIQFKDRQILSQVILQVDDFGANQLASFVDDTGVLRILIATPDRINGTSMYSIDQNGQSIDETHSVSSQKVSSMSVWKLSLNSEWQLATANQFDYQAYLSSRVPMRVAVPEPRPYIKIFSWKPTYFDSYQLITLPHDGQVNKVEPMNVNGQEMLIVAMEPHQTGTTAAAAASAATKQQVNYNTHRVADSHLFKLDFGDGNLQWKHYQSLNTQLALDVKSFVITHQNSLIRHYFIALLGQPVASPAAAAAVDQQQQQQQVVGNQFGLIIYKYFGDRFVAITSTPALGATKLDAISYGAGDSYVVIALLNEWSNQVNLYLYDGILIKLLPSPFPQISSNSVVQNQPLRPRRTMDAPPVNLHLFAEQQTPVVNVENMASNEEVGQSVKRTLEVQSTGGAELQLPTIAISLPFNSSDDTETTTAGSSAASTLYSIPVDELIRSEEKEQYSKRTLSNTSDLIGWCQSKVKELLVDNFEQSSRQLRSLPRVDQRKPIEFHGDLLIDGDMSVSNLLLVDRVEQQVDGGGTQKRQLVVTPTPGAIPQVSNFSNTFFEDIQRLHLEIDSLKQQVDQILVDDGSIQDVFRPIAFDETVVVECNSNNNHNNHLLMMNRQVKSSTLCPLIGELLTVHLNAHNVSNIQQEAMLTGRMMVINKDVRFEHLILRGEVDIAGTLNNLPISEIVFKKGPSMDIIRGPKNFRNGLFSSSELLVDNWDGAHISRDNYLTTTGEQRVDANLRFSQVIIDPLIGSGKSSASTTSRFEKLNNLHLDSHLNNIALSDGQGVSGSTGGAQQLQQQQQQVVVGNNFEVPLIIDELILNGNTQFTSESKLSGVDLEDLWSNVMLKQSNQNVSAPVEFTGQVHVTHGGDIAVFGPINNYDFSPQRILMRSRNFTFVNPVHFEQDVNAQDLQVNFALNGIQVHPDYETRRPELAILLDGGTQVLSGDKLLNDIHLGGQSSINGLINGHLDLAQLHKLATWTGNSHRFANIRLTGSNIRLDEEVADMVISQTINNYSTQELCSLANRLALEPETRYNRLKFESTVHFNKLRCSSINGFNNLSNFFLTKYGDQRIAGELRLTGGVVFNTSVRIESTLNRLQVAPLASAISRKINETLSGQRVVVGDLIVDDLFIDNRINDLQMSNVLLTKADQPQIIRAPMTFDHLDIENVLSIGNNLFTQSFNGLNLSEVLGNTLQYDTPQVIYNHLQLQRMHILPGADLITPSLNGQDLRRLANDAVLIDVAQQILAPKTFKTPVEFSSRLNFKHNIDGLSSEELRNILLLQSDELINGDLELNNDLIVRKDLEIQSGIINDIDINTFVQSMLYENRTKSKGLRIFGNGTVSFKDVKVNNLVVAGTVQGVDLSKEALMRADNAKGALNFKISEQQKLQNNARLISSGASLRVSSNYRNQSLLGTCQVHSCWANAVKVNNITTVWQPVFQAPQALPQVSQPAPQVTQPLPQVFQPSPQVLQVQTPAQVQIVQPQTNQPPQSLVQQPIPLLPTPLIPQPVNSQVQVKQSAQVQVAQVFQPPPLPFYLQPTQQVLYQPVQNSTNFIQTLPPPVDHLLPETRYLEYQRAQAVQELSYRVNKYLMASLFYEIAQREPLLGPVLSSVDNPAALSKESKEQLLLLKGITCGRRNRQQQTVAIMAQSSSHSSSFSQISSIKDVNDPIAVRSLVVDNHFHYLITLDLNQILIHLWNASTAMYEYKSFITVDGSPTALKAFSVANLGCIAYANPRVNQGQVTVLCQRTSGGYFEQRTILPLLNVFELDFIPQLSGKQSTEIIFAALAQPINLHIGELTINVFDIRTGGTRTIASRLLTKPLKLHFVRQHSTNTFTTWQLLISEAITSSDDTQANTRIFTLRLTESTPLSQLLTTSQFYQSQLLRDNQFYDIQSVQLNGAAQSMLFFQSAHSISIYAPELSLDSSGLCDTQYTLVQRLPTKGANRFLVFNDHRPAKQQQQQQQQPLVATNKQTNYLDLFSHLLVLSRDDCELQQYSNLILRAKFK